MVLVHPKSINLQVFVGIDKNLEVIEIPGKENRTYESFEEWMEWRKKLKLIRGFKWGD